MMVVLVGVYQLSQHLRKFVKHIVVMKRHYVNVRVAFDMLRLIQLNEHIIVNQHEKSMVHKKLVYVIMRMQFAYGQRLNTEKNSQNQYVMNFDRQIANVFTMMKKYNKVSV